MPGWHWTRVLQEMLADNTMTAYVFRFLLLIGERQPPTFHLLQWPSFPAKHCHPPVSPFLGAHRSWPLSMQSEFPQNHRQGLKTGESLLIWRQHEHRAGRITDDLLRISSSSVAERCWPIDLRCCRHGILNPPMAVHHINYSPKLIGESSKHLAEK